MADRWPQVAEIYLAAVERGKADRAAFVREACAGDEDLRREVESLLGHEGGAEAVLERPAVALAAPMLNTSASSAVLTGRQIGPYQIGGLLAKGGMGEVYRARDTKLNREVALKILPTHLTEDPERRARFAREARVLATLNHPHIGAIYGLEESDGVTGLILELVDGLTLADLIAGRPMSLADALTLARQIAEALEAAHEKGIVHRDLKPGNILLQRVSDTGSVTSDLRVKVVDFGLAKPVQVTQAGALTEAEADTFEQTVEGRLLGTPGYMSPEQVRGKAVTRRTDVWAFGCVLFEMVTGRRAFGGETTSDILAAVLQQQVDWSALPEETPSGVRRLLKRCLEREANNRLHDIADARLDIDEALADVTAASPMSATPDRPARHRHRQFIAAAAILLAVGVGTWLLLRDAGAPPASPTVVPLTALPGDESYATLSPDGTQVAFAWSGETRENWDIYVQQVGTSTPTQLTSHPAEDGAPAWSPDGTQIAFLRREREEDELTIFLTAPLTPNAEHKLASLHFPGGLAPAPALKPTVSWSPDNEGLLIVEHDVERRMNGVVLIPVGRGERRRLLWTPVAQGAYHFPTISPDAKALAYARCSGEGSCHAYVQHLGADLALNGSPRRLTDENTLVRRITWAVDRRSLIFAIGGGYSSSLWRASLEGGPADRIDIAGDRAAFPSVASRSGLLAYTRLDYGADIWRLDSNGVKPFLPSTYDDRNPQFSPDGRRVAFESRRLGKESQLWVANADGSNLAPLNGGDRGIAGSPRWSFDSRWIVFDGMTQDHRGIFIIDSAGGQPTLLAEPGGLPSWSPDGKWIYFSSARSGRAEIWRVSVGGGDAEPITDQGGGNPLVSPDGETLYYTKRNWNGNSLFARPVAGGPERQVLQSMSLGQHSYFPVIEGIYYLSRTDPKSPTMYDVRFFSFATKASKTLHRFESLGATITVSRDQKTFLLTGTPISGGSDLMLIRNFR